MSLQNIFNVAGSGMSAQSIRLNTVSSNIANAEAASSSEGDTYRARKPIFSAMAHEQMRLQGSLGIDSSGSSPYLSGFDSQAEQAASQGVGVKGIVESQAPLQPRYEPNHPSADENGYVFYPNVNVVEEMADMISASRSFQMNVEVMNTAKTMIQQVLTLGQ
ncbi:MAG: flagellar basal body rod protein FlgC [unclassified Hahellaceae]|nr:flagellar basal body rod protein FlgC [Hahellaceae bacterium]|tara:strand:- start:70083 stop:70568 length:486 start_codon:yes stop_codon:yes gene_type:complete